MRCRLVTSEDEKRIRELLDFSGGGWLRELDWSHPDGWLGVEDGELEAIIKLAPGKPVAHLENLIINEKLPHKKQAQLFKVLMLTALQSLRIYGAQIVLGSVPDSLPDYKKVLLKRGGRVLTHGDLIAVRLK